MQAITLLLALITLGGIACRMLPASLAALPFVANVVSLTPWLVGSAVIALAFSFIPAWRHHHEARLFVRIIAACAIALEVAWQAPFFIPSQRVTSALAADDSQATTLRVMTCNVYKGNASAERIVELVRENNIQVLALQETTVDFVSELKAAGIDELLPYSERSSSDGVYGNGVWSALPLSDAASDDIGSSASAMPAGTIEVTRPDGATARLRIVSVHTCSPALGYWDLWEKSITEIGVARERLAEHDSLDYVLLGDFNATYDHAPFREMLGEGTAADSPRLHDAARECGAGITSTWPANLEIPAFCSIDHVVTSERVVATEVSTAEVPGSDHLALIATLEL